MENLPVARTTLTTLRRASAAPLPGVLALCGPSELTVAAATALATAKLPASALALDLHVARHEKDRWSVEELTERVLRPATLVPMHTAFVVVQDAHRMDAALADHLLKTLEEPSGPTVFVLCVPSVDHLPATLRSRIGNELRVDPAPLQDTRRELELAGVAPELARDLAQVITEVPALLPLLQHTPSHAAAAHTAFCSSLRTAHPAILATAVTAAIETVARALLESAGERTTDTALRSRSRELCAIAIGQWRSSLRAELRAATTAPELELVSRSAAALDELERAVWRYRPLAASLTAALAG